MVAAFRRGTFGTGVVRTTGLALQQSGVVSLGTATVTTADINSPNVALLAKTTSVNTATNNTFLDNSSNAFTITRNGSATQGSFTPYWPSGYWSNYFNGSTDYLITTSMTAAGTGSVTYECWFNARATSGILLNSRSGNTTDGIDIQVDSNSKISITYTNTILYTGTLTIALNAWYHVAVVRNGTTNWTVFINGQIDGTFSNTVNITSTTFTVGLTLSGSVYFNGYVSNARVANSAVYTVAFTPSTTPLTAITNTQLLTCQSNRFRDANTQVAEKTITVNGSPKVQAFQPFPPPATYDASAYGGSGYFNGSTDYLSLTGSNSNLYLPGAFTWEAWVYPISTNGLLYGTWNNAASNPDGWAFWYNNAGSFPATGNTARIYWYDGNYGSNECAKYSTTALPLNQWNHLVFQRDSSNVIKFFLNGVSLTLANVSVNGKNFDDTFAFNNTAPVGIGGTASYTTFNGYISNMRFVQGVAVYTGAFTPPTGALTQTGGTYSSATNVTVNIPISNTKLLTNFANAGIYDIAVQNNQVTVGDAQASTTQFKWSPTSMRFDGTGDWLTAIDGPQLQIGTGDFTIDGWVYLSATGVAYGIISKGTASTGWSVNVTSGNRLQFSYTSSNLTGATSLAAATWYYFAVVRSGSATGNLKIYLNGTVDATSGSAVTDNFNQTSTLYVGADRVGGSALNGYLQDIRTTKYARTISTPTATFSVGTATTYIPTIPDAPIIANITTITNTSVKIGYMAPLLNGGSTITSYTAVSTPGGITGTSVTARSGTITIGGLAYNNTYTFAVYATNSVGTSTYSASTKSITTPLSLGRIFILSEMELALVDYSMLNTIIAGSSKAKSYALATIYGSD